MNSLFTSEVVNEDDIRSLITNEVEESINLDFKAAEALDKSDKKKDEISKDISAFANSAGGTIVYGINERDHKAASISPINGNIYTKEWLEQVIQSRIQRKIDGIRIHPIRITGRIEESVYVVNIPESGNAPHMAFDNRFYKRYNFESVRMEEYEVRQLYFRQSKTQLRRDSVLINPRGSLQSGGKLQHIDFSLGFQVKNVGGTIENQYKLEIWVPEFAYNGYNNSTNPIAKYFIRKDSHYSVFSVPNDSPLFQNEVTTMITCFIRVDKGTLLALSGTPLVTKLYYSNGIDQGEMDLTKELSYAGGLLSSDKFQ